MVTAIVHAVLTAYLIGQSTIATLPEEQDAITYVNAPVQAEEVIEHASKQIEVLASVDSTSEKIIEETEEPTSVEPEEEIDEYDLACRNGDYCEAREHYSLVTGYHKFGTGCKFEQKHPEECREEPTDEIQN